MKIHLGYAGGMQAESASPAFFGDFMNYFLCLLMGLVFCSLAFADNNLGLPPLKIPENNPQTVDKIALGRQLFNDKRFSADASISCASCHQAAKAFTDGLPLAMGIKGQTGTRNSPTVVNAAFYDTLFLDGRESSLEGQALGPFINPREHGLSNHQTIIAVIQKDNDYIAQFNKVFALTAEQINIEHVINSIASFERTLIAGNSPFDQYFFARDQSALTPSAARGLRVFRRKGNCANCHEISWDNALFTDNRFYNIGVGFKRLRTVLDEFIARVSLGESPEGFPLTDLQRSELGRFNVTQAIADIGKFKTPTLRNIELTGPYMHDGSMATLEKVVEYYNQGGDENRFLDPAIFPLNMTTQEKSDLVEFLQALTSARYSGK